MVGIYLQTKCDTSSTKVSVSSLELTPPPPLPDQRGGVHTRMRVRGWESPNSDDWREGLILSLLCVACTKPEFVNL